MEQYFCSEFYQHHSEKPLLISVSLKQDINGSVDMINQKKHIVIPPEIIITLTELDGK